MTMRFGFLSTHPPTRCGLATFNAALADSLVADGAAGGIVRVTTAGERSADELSPAKPEVIHTWTAEAPGGWNAAADALNAFDLAMSSTNTASTRALTGRMCCG